ncbi:anaerobic benzoate catabolism transcriptional regulator [mine drainage metagenome]|uniref:Anaerobic benzoate catabolism transcriptional regulator n=1 Tax=mine drainage metagenome TaxID=410659 RepID=A0A1J5Q5K4_9ZZZZ
MEFRPPIRTSEEWEADLGRQVRQLRLRQNRTQSDLAGAANISLSALKTLELGHGSSVRTLISVARALDRSDWLTALAPPEPSVSPMQLLKERKKQATSVRKRATAKAL